MLVLLKSSWSPGETILDRTCLVSVVNLIYFMIVTHVCVCVCVCKHSFTVELEIKHWIFQFLALCKHMSVTNSICSVNIGKKKIVQNHCVWRWSHWPWFLSPGISLHSHSFSLEHIRSFIIKISIYSFGVLCDYQ